MAQKLSRLTVAVVRRALFRGGWQLKRQGAAHELLTHRDKGGRVTLSRHLTETLKPKTLQSILDQAGLTIDEFRELL